MKTSTVLLITAAGLAIAAGQAEPPTTGAISSPVAAPAAGVTTGSGVSYNDELWQLREAQVEHEGIVSKAFDAGTNAAFDASNAQLALLEKQLATAKMQLLAIQEQERLRQEKVAKGECLCGDKCQCRLSKNGPISLSQPAELKPVQQPVYRSTYYQPQNYSACGPGGCSPSGRRVFRGGIF